MNSLSLHCVVMCILSVVFASENKNEEEIVLRVTGLTKRPELPRFLLCCLLSRSIVLLD